MPILQYTYVIVASRKKYNNINKLQEYVKNSWRKYVPIIHLKI